MPRGRRLHKFVFGKTVPPRLHTKGIRPLDGDGPRLWNAGRRIKSSKGLSHLPAAQLKSIVLADDWPSEIVPPPGFSREELNGEWWKLDTETLKEFMKAHPVLRTMSDDVKDFVQQGSINLDRSQILKILSNPSRYFSRPHNVPLSMRKQVSFPKVDDTVVLLRTPNLGPRYAAFEVPLHFTKLHLQAYLKNVYDVDVLHIRSAIKQHKVERKEGRDQYSQGALFRPPSQKKMTCQLAKPFVYPEEPANLDAWQYDDYWTSMKASVALNRENSDWGLHNPDLKHRKAIAQQAQQLLTGKVRWGPTWQNFESDWRAMHGPGS